jgi:hypothetical protein
MKITKLFVLLAIAYYVAGAKKSDNFEGGYRYKAVKCAADSRYAVVKVCNVKAYSRRVSSINFDVDFLKPLDRPFYFRALFQLRTGQKYHTLVDTKNIEVCSVVDGNEPNKLVEYIVSTFKYYAPNLFHKCPYTNIKGNNVSLLSDVVPENDNFDPAQWVPPGIHRYDIFLLKNRVVVFNVNASVEFKTTRDNSFAMDRFIKQYI